MSCKNDPSIPCALRNSIQRFINLLGDTSNGEESSGPSATPQSAAASWLDAQHEPMQVPAPPPATPISRSMPPPPPPPPATPISRSKPPPPPPPRAHCPGESPPSVQTPAEQPEKLIMLQDVLDTLPAELRSQLIMTCTAVGIEVESATRKAAQQKMLDCMARRDTAPQLKQYISQVLMLLGKNSTGFSDSVVRGNEGPHTFGVPSVPAAPQLTKTPPGAGYPPSAPRASVPPPPPPTPPLPVAPPPLAKPPPPAPPQEDRCPGATGEGLAGSLLACATPGCRFLVHGSVEFGGYCCRWCHNHHTTLGYHDERHGNLCKRTLAPPGTPVSPPIAPSRPVQASRRASRQVYQNGTGIATGFAPAQYWRASEAQGQQGQEPLPAQPPARTSQPSVTAAPAVLTDEDFVAEVTRINRCRPDDWRAILGLSSGPPSGQTLLEAQRTYRQKMRILHPDKRKSSSESMAGRQACEAATEKVQAAVEAARKLEKACQWRSW